jgi:hypothetical protein
MSKVLTEELEQLEKKDLSSFFKKNLQAIMRHKKKGIKTFDSPVGMPYFYKPFVAGKVGVECKAIKDIEYAPEDAETLWVKLAANTSMYCDSYMDVLLRNAGKKSMRENKDLIRHLPDHDWSVKAEVGKVQDVYYEDRALRELNINMDGSAQVLTMESLLIKKWDEIVFDKYRTGRIKQHSIGIRYINYLFAINEPEDEYWKDEYKVWKKYFDDIINKDYVEQRGYFFAVSEFELLENSAVLFGANRLTPTLETGEKSFTETQPLEQSDTEEQPNNKTEEPVNISALIGEMKLFN